MIRTTEVRPVLADPRMPWLPGLRAAVVRNNREDDMRDLCAKVRG